MPLASGPQGVAARDLECIDVALRLLDADRDRLGVEHAPYGGEVAAGTRGGSVGPRPGFIGLRACLVDLVAGALEPHLRVGRSGLGAADGLLGLLLRGVGGAFDLVDLVAQLVQGALRILCDAARRFAQVGGHTLLVVELLLLCGELIVLLLRVRAERQRPGGKTDRDDGQADRRGDPASCVVPRRTRWLRVWIGHLGSRAVDKRCRRDSTGSTRTAMAWAGVPQGCAPHSP